MQVLGSNQSMWAIGDASTVFSPKALDYADELFEQADDDNSNDLSLKQLQVRRLDFRCYRFGQRFASFVTCCAAMCPREHAARRCL